MNPNVITEALSTVDWRPLISGVVTSAFGLYIFLQLRYFVSSVIAFQRSRNGKAIQGDWVMLKDQKQWEVMRIGFRWVELKRAEKSKDYTKYIRTKDWCDIEITKVHSTNGEGK